MLAFLTDPQVVRKILEHLGMQTTPLPLGSGTSGAWDLGLWPAEEGSREWEGSEALRRERWEADSGEGDSERGPP